MAGGSTPTTWKLGLGCCGDCESAVECPFSLRAWMGDGMHMDAAGVTVTLEVLTRPGGVQVATSGALSPASSGASLTGVTLAPGTDYTARMTVAQTGGSTCVFDREFSTADPCRPGGFIMHIPRIWFKFTACGGAQHVCYPYPCEMDVAASGPGGFAWSGNTGATPVSYELDPCYAKFTPCADGTYTLSGTSTIPNTINPTLDLTLPAGTTSTESAYWQQLTGSSGDAAVHPAAGFVWPAECEDPASSTLSLSSTKYGSGTLSAVADGACGDGWAGGTSGGFEGCGGGTEPVTVAWTLSFSGYYDPLALRTTWTAQLVGVVSPVCFCAVPDAYGQCRWTLAAGGGGQAYLYGEAVLGVTDGHDPLCADCSALDLSFTVAFFAWVQGQSSVCPDQEPECGYPIQPLSMGDEVTVTS